LRDATDRGEGAVDKAHNLAHGNGVGRLGQKVAPFCPRLASMILACLSRAKICSRNAVGILSLSTISCTRRSFRPA
jgi:hypothetical protein